MRVILDFGWLDQDLVGYKLIKYLSDNWGEKDLGILFPRGHGKTLPMSTIVMQEMIRNPDVAILEVSNTEPNANKFGDYIGQTLLGNEFLQMAFGTKYNHGNNAILPSSASECTRWGEDGYILPNRKPRLDPTLMCISSRAAKAGRHPDWIYLDDLTEEENNTPKEWAKTCKIVEGLCMTLPSNGFFIWTATRWGDGDPIGSAISGKLIGKQGPFKVIKESCYIDDNPNKGVTYSKKVRWNMKTPTGYSLEQLEADRKAKGVFFNAQMRNDPAPLDVADIKVNYINIYEPEEAPKTGACRIFGIETTGGGKPIFNGFREYLQGIPGGSSIPLMELEDSRSKGQSKKDRIVAALQPLVDKGAIYARQWMIGEVSSTEGLGYELRRLGAAAHDDIADCLHNVPLHLAKGITPKEANEPADLYICVDLAWSEEKRSDFTVIMAVAVDHKKQFWVLDYDRFQLSSPTGIYNRLLSFYTKWNEPLLARSQKGKYPGAWR
jgi:hypothetical protein